MITNKKIYEYGKGEYHWVMGLLTLQNALRDTNASEKKIDKAIERFRKRAFEAYKHGKISYSAYKMICNI